MEVIGIIRDIILGVKTVLRTKLGLFWFIGLSLFIFWLLIMIPVWTTPGNDFLFQLKILTNAPALFIVVIVLSIVNALLIAMQIYIKKAVTEKRKGDHSEATTASSALLSILASLLACSACYSAVLAVFGLGTTAFLVKWRLPIAFVALVIAGYAIYKASKRINGNCTVCKI